MNVQPSMNATGCPGDQATSVVKRIRHIMFVQTICMVGGVAVGAVIGAAMNDFPTAVTWGVTVGAVIGSPLFHRSQAGKTSAHFLVATPIRDRHDSGVNQ